MGNDNDRFLKTTYAYYSKWLGRDGILTQDFEGVQFVYSEQRNIAQYGYSRRFDLYVWRQKDRMVVSYGDRARDRLEILREAVKETMSAEEIRRTLEKLFEGKTDHSIKYLFEEMLPSSLPTSPSEVRALTTEDYGLYKEFWQKCNPGCNNTDWLREYFEEMVREHTCAGVFADNVLVSCTDAPGMPYMEREAQEVGINTLREYRRQGHAAAACAKCISGILENGRVPLWSTSVENIASQRLAEKTGFVKLAEVVSATFS